MRWAQVNDLQEYDMQEILYVFRLHNGGLVITTDPGGSKLPIDAALDYKPGDWNFVDTILGSELPKMLMDHRDVEPALTAVATIPSGAAPPSRAIHSSKSIPSKQRGSSCPTHILSASAARTR
jgi:hypothetical protein